MQNKWGQFRKWGNWSSVHWAKHNGHSLNEPSVWPCECELTLSLQESGFVSDLRLAPREVEMPDVPGLLPTEVVPGCPKGGGKIGLLKIQLRIENLGFFRLLLDFFELLRERPEGAPDESA